MSYEVHPWLTFDSHSLGYAKGQLVPQTKLETLEWSEMQRPLLSNQYSLVMATIVSAMNNG